ncbi:hypothetical protein SADUNF_Sadunf03G0076700 [Salix dunnii]|uniref:RING-type domain-containing protein n=1 Tax=Salix dunnii TaxID=1413687 RepID=A0A835K7M4_9ROSI|nr:hypothetical protein SADUNF_Sadunf03G0076700 [Salix dunnii]
MEWGFVHKAWEKWTSINVGSSNGEPLKSALLINYDPNAPSRLLSIIAEQEGINATPTEVSQFVDFVRRNKLQSENFTIGQNQYVVTSIHENCFCARSVTTSEPAGEGAIIMQTSAFLFVALYDGSIGAASRAMVAADQFAWQLGRRNLLLAHICSCYLCRVVYVDSKSVTGIIATQFPSNLSIVVCSNESNLLQKLSTFRKVAMVEIEDVKTLAPFNFSFDVQSEMMLGEMGSSGSKEYRGGAPSSSSSGSGRKGKSKGRSKVFQSSCLGTSCGSRDSTSGDHVCDNGNKENYEGNASSTNRNEIDSDEVKIECYGKVREEQSDEMPCISSDAELDEWNQTSITNTSSRTGSSSARAAAPTQSLTFPSRLLSRLSFIPGNVSFRLSRAVSLGSSHPTGPRMFDGEDEIRHCSESANSVVDGNGNEIQQISDLLATSLVNRTAAHHHEDMAAGLQLHSQASDLLDNMQENQNIFSTRNSGRGGGGNRAGVDANLRSPRLFNDMDGTETRLSDRRTGAREPAERNVHFSRTLSVGRLRDRVLRRSSLPDRTFCPLQQEREIRGSSQGSGRQAVGGEMRVLESEGNALSSTTALVYPSSGMSSSLFSIQDHEVETSQTREARYHDLLEHRSNFLERRRRIRSQRLGSRFENLSGHERTCILSGQHRTGRCTCRVNNRDANLNDDTNARASISRIVMLAEALFEVLDEIHQQSVVLSSRPSMSSLGSVPAPNEIVESLPVKLYAKSQKHPNEDTAQCYICLVEYEEGDSMRVLPCHHEFHRTCVDKWLMEIHRVCPLCRGDICRFESSPDEN